MIVCGIHINRNIWKPSGSGEALKSYTKSASGRQSPLRIKQEWKWNQTLIKVFGCWTLLSKILSLKIARIAHLQAETAIHRNNPAPFFDNTAGDL